MRWLPAEHRRALSLVAFEGLSYAEAGRTRGCNEGTIKSRIARARDKLHQALGSGAARPRHRCLFPREDKLRSRVHAVHYLYEIVGKDGKS